MPSFEPVRSIQRGLMVLRAISEHGAVNVTQLVSLCKLPQPTIVRIVETLVDAGYVYRQADEPTYKVTGHTLSLSRGYNLHDRLTEIARPIVHQLHIDIGWPSNLAVFDGDSMVIIYSNRAALGLSIPGRIGARIPMVSTGVGLMTLASMSPDERKSALLRARLAHKRWDDNPTLLAALPEKLEEARTRGYAFADENYLLEVYQSRIWAIAVPVETQSGEYVALSSLVLSIAGNPARMYKAILPQLTAAAAKIGDLLRSE